MYARKMRRGAAPAVAEKGAAPEQRVPDLPNSAHVGANTPSDPALAEKMQAHMSERFPGMDILRRGSGRPLEVPEELRENLQNHFGHSIDNISFRESSDAADLGAKAYARGNEIHFAPGQFRPDTALGRKMIGHELSHIRQQAEGGLGGGVLLDSSMEHQADVDGEAVSSGEYAPAHASALSPMPAASFAAAPAQGWGLKEHGILTELARQKASQYAAKRANDQPTANPQDQQNVQAYQRIVAANEGQGEFDSEKAKRSLAYGAKFNDVGHHSVAGFGLNYIDHKSAFINQSHHGDMQFLHSMDSSGGDTVENMAKARRYARFASEVYQNKNDLQSQNMLDYVLADRGKTDMEDSDVGRTNGEGNPTRFQEMMLSTMLSAKTMKAIDKQVADIPNEAERKRQRMALIKQAAENGQREIQAAREKYQNKSEDEKAKAGSEAEYIRKKAKKAGMSKYAAGSVGDFFTGGNEELDAGMVALGSASHMIEDSYAGAHASRGENLHLGGEKATELSETGQEIAAKSTDVITTGDYNTQDSSTPYIDLLPGIEKGRHNKGDEFAPTDSADQNEIVDNTRGGSLGRDAAAQFMMMNAREKYGGEGGANDFLKKILKADVAAQSLPDGPTKTGSSYTKKVKGNTKKEKKAANDFYASTESRAHNTHTTASERAQTYTKQMEQLQTLRSSGKDTVKKHYTQQSNEMLANIRSMIKQLENAGTLDADNAKALQDLKNLEVQLSSQLNVPSSVFTR